MVVLNRNYIIIISLLMLLTGCAGNSVSVDSTAQSPNIDPLEPYNRTMFRFNEKVDKVFMHPVTTAYQNVVPSPARTAVSNFFNNLRDIVSMGSNLLRLDITKASEDFVRVGFNSTFGLGGLIDMADYAGMPNNKNTLGDTFATWGWKNSSYFVYPFFGPSTVRDSLGNTLTYFVSPKRFLFHQKPAYFGSIMLEGVDRRAKYLGFTNVLAESAPPDEYAYVRDFYMNIRNSQTGGTVRSNTDSLDIDDLVAPPDSYSTDNKMDKSLIQSDRLLTKQSRIDKQNPVNSWQDLPTKEYQLELAYFTKYYFPLHVDNIWYRIVK